MASGWDNIRSALAENRPIAAIVGLVSVGIAGIGAISNGVSVMDVIGGKDAAGKAAIEQAQQRETKALETASEAQTRANAQAELAGWTAALEANTAAAFEFYVRAFPQGAHRAQAEAALANLPPQAVARTPFALDRLHPTVAQAVAAARQAADDAARRQTDAERAANMAVAAALQARSRVRGFAAIRNAEGDLFEGEAAAGKPQGLGVYTQGDAPFAGDKYQGQFSAGAWNGVGVFDAAPGGPPRPPHYAGEFTAGRIAGVGVIVRSDGARMAGAVRDGALDGHGVETRADGSRFEGEFRNGAAYGYGVLWSADGAVIEAGRYENGQLVQPLGL